MCFTKDGQEKPIVAVLWPKPRDNSNKNSNIYFMICRQNKTCPQWQQNWAGAHTSQNMLELT